MGPIGVLVIIGLIGYAVVSFVWKQIEAANQNAQGRAAGNDPRPRQAGSEIDRFLQEIDRLRRRREAEEAAANRPAPPPPPPSRQQPTRPQPTAQRPRTTERPRQPDRSKPVPVLTAVPGQRGNVPHVPVAFIEPAALAAPVSTSTLEGDTQAPSVVIQPVQRSAATDLIVKLLGNPQTLPAAFILREVLDRPRSARRS